MGVPGPSTSVSVGALMTGHDRGKRKAFTPSPPPYPTATIGVNSNNPRGRAPCEKDFNLIQLSLLKLRAIYESILCPVLQYWSITTERTAGP